MSIESAESYLEKKVHQKFKRPLNKMDKYLKEEVAKVAPNADDYEYEAMIRLVLSIRKVKNEIPSSTK